MPTQHRNRVGAGRVPRVSTYFCTALYENRCSDMPAGESQTRFTASASQLPVTFPKFVRGWFRRHAASGTPSNGGVCYCKIGIREYDIQRSRHSLECGALTPSAEPPSLGYVVSQLRARADQKKNTVVLKSLSKRASLCVVMSCFLLFP